MLELGGVPTVAHRVNALRSAPMNAYAAALTARTDRCRKTDNAKCEGFGNALRGNLEDAFRAGDRGVGVNVLQPLYARTKDKPVSVELDSL
jgi:hypothetical protein